MTTGTLQRWNPDTDKYETWAKVSSNTPNIHDRIKRLEDHAKINHENVVLLDEAIGKLEDRIKRLEERYETEQIRDMMRWGEDWG